MEVHYENNQPFMAVTDMTRLIEVSHWGNIAVEETIDVRHTGALLQGSFSRYDYQRNQDGYNSIKSFTVCMSCSLCLCTSFCKRNSSYVYGMLCVSDAAAL